MHIVGQVAVGGVSSHVPVQVVQPVRRSRRPPVKQLRPARLLCQVIERGTNLLQQRLTA